MENMLKAGDFNPNHEPVMHFMDKIGRRLFVVNGINQGHNTLGSLLKAIPSLKQGTLLDQLKKLEDDDIIERRVFHEVPTRVEYRISEYGKTLLPVIMVIQEWGLRDISKG